MWYLLLEPRTPKYQQLCRVPLSLTSPDLRLPSLNSTINIHFPPWGVGKRNSNVKECEYLNLHRQIVISLHYLPALSQLKSRVSIFVFLNWLHSKELHNSEVSLKSYTLLQYCSFFWKIFKNISETYSFRYVTPKCPFLFSVSPLGFLL